MHAAGHDRGPPIDNGIDHVQHVTAADGGNFPLAPARRHVPFDHAGDNSNLPVFGLVPL